MSAELTRLRAAVKLASIQLENYLMAKYPEGMSVGVRLSVRQVNPTWGVVYRVWGDNVQVHFEGARRPYRLIQPEDIIAIGDPA